MNRNASLTSLTTKDVSFAIAELMPNIIRGVQLDFFVKKGVTQTQFLMLAAIRAYGRCSMGALAKSLHVRMPTATGIIDRLAHAGYVQRLHTAEDRRQVVVELTRKGQGFMHEFESVIRQRWEEVLKSLSAKELKAFYHVITKLRLRLQPQS